MANATVTMSSSADSKEARGIHGLQLLSAVANNFLHGNVQSHPKVSIESRHYGLPLISLPLVSACSSPTENTFHSKNLVYSTLREKARSIGKSKSAIPVRASRLNTKASTFRNIVHGSCPKLSTHFPVATSGDLKLEMPDLVPPSPPTYLQELSNHQKIQELYLQQAKGLLEKHVLNEGRSTDLLYAPNLKAGNDKSTPKTTTRPAATKVSVTALTANGERVISKKSMAEINYIKHKAVPMREKWMARFLELAEFKKKFGHTKVPHNFPDSPKLAEWQKFQRQQRKLFVKGKHSQLTPERVVMLEKIGFVWEARIDAWESHYQNLKRFKETHGHIYVPVANTVLSQWVKRQRKQYKKYEKGQESSLTKDRVDRLNKLGFIWDGRHLTE